MRRVLTIALPLILILEIAIWRSEGPAPLPVTAPEKSFSGERADRSLEWLLEDRVPHPIGTSANARVRSGLISQFRALGYRAETQRKFVCNAYGNCGYVINVVASNVEPRPRLNAVVVTAHYDSVGASPGASDDGMGIASLLEIARAVAKEKFRNRVIFLATDGEEAGLLGAEAFVSDAQLMRDVRAVINIENRGTWGASNMFETSSGNARLVGQLANALDRPSASSLFGSIYELLPNDTDLTVYRRAGLTGVNFAALNGVNWYHTPLDDLDHASPRTLQHHGENALGTLRVLANADLTKTSRTNAVYFDLLGLLLVRWPEWFSYVLALTAALLLFLATRGTITLKELGAGGAAGLVALLLAGGAGYALATLARLRADGINWIAHPLPLVVSMWLIGIAAAIAAVRLLLRWGTPRGLLSGIVLLLILLGVTLCILLPGASYLLIVPALAAALMLLLSEDELLPAWTGAVVAALLVFPLAIVLHEALGGGLAFAIAIVVALVSMLFAPSIPSSRIAGGAALLALLFALGSLLLPAATAERPRQVSVGYVDDAAAPTPFWTTSWARGALGKAAPFKPADRSLTPWSRTAPLTAPAPNATIPRVRIDGTREGNRLRINVRPQREVNRITLMVKGNVRVLSVNDAPLPPRPARFRDRTPAGWTRLTASAVKEMVAVVETEGPVTAWAWDLSFGLPAPGGPLAEARNRSVAVPVQDGDVTVTRARASF